MDKAYRLVLKGFDKLPKQFKRIDDRWTFNGKKLAWLDVVEWSMKNDLQVLIKYGQFRKEVVDQLLSMIKKEIRCNDCSFKSVGSVSFTSDYDVSAFGKKKEEVVKLFNERFNSLFNEESGVVFDTNVYGVTSLMPTSKKLSRNSTYTAVEVCNDDECKRYKYVDVPKGVTADIANQRSWAFIKLFRYLDSDEIRDLQKRTRRLKLKILNSDVENSVQRYKQLKKVGDFNSLATMNKIYNSMLLRVKKAREQMEMFPKSLLHKITYKDAESHANFFSSESYYTQGAFFHVVVRDQMNIKSVDITENELLDSFIENVGDMIKEIKHSANVNCSEVVVKLSKYLMRLLDAVVAIQKKQPGCMINKMSVDEIVDARQTAVDIRKNIRGKKIADNCKGETDACVERSVVNARVKDLLRSLKIDRCALVDIKSWMMEFLVDVLYAHYREVNGRVG